MNEIENMVKEHVEMGVITPSTNSYLFPMVMVPKRDGGWQMCTNFGELNKL